MGLQRHPGEAVLNSFKRVISRYGASAMSGGLLVLPLVYGSYLAWQELQYRDALGPAREFAPVSAPVVPAAQPFKAQAIATVMGLNTQATWVPRGQFCIDSRPVSSAVG